MTRMMHASGMATAARGHRVRQLGEHGPHAQGCSDGGEAGPALVDEDDPVRAGEGRDGVGVEGPNDSGEGRIVAHRLVRQAPPAHGNLPASVPFDVVPTVDQAEPLEPPPRARAGSLLQQRAEHGRVRFASCRMSHGAIVAKPALPRRGPSPRGEKARRYS